MTKIFVRAAPGVRVPREENPQKYITVEQGIVAVENTHYYHQQVRDGDLILCDDPALADAKEAEPDASVQPAPKAKKA